MSFTLIETSQRSEAWYAARAGRLTGSCAESVIKERKRGSGDLKERIDLRLRLVAERLTGTSLDKGFVSDDMQRGIDKERDARAAYDAMTGLLMKPSGFLSHDIYMAGCSLDGYVGNFDGIVELKCPKSTTHLEYLRANAVPEEYVAQITHNLWISGAAWCDFVSFDDRYLDTGLHLVRVRVPRDDKKIAAYETAALKFLAEVDFDVMELQRRTAKVA